MEEPPFTLLLLSFADPVLTPQILRLSKPAGGPRKMWLGLGQGHLSQGWPSDWSLWPWFLPSSCKLRLFEIPLMAEGRMCWTVQPLSQGR